MSSFYRSAQAEAKEVLDIMRLSKDQQYSYNRYLDYLHYKASEAISVTAETEEKIREKIAKNFKNLGLSNEDIAKGTGLSLDQIQKL